MTDAFSIKHFGDDATGDPGAHRLAERIKRYWRERGYEVHVREKRLPFHHSLRIAPLTLESDMINGLPREAFHKQKQGQAA